MCAAQKIGLKHTRWRASYSETIALHFNQFWALQGSAHNAHRKTIEFIPDLDTTLQ